MPSIRWGPCGLGIPLVRKGWAINWAMLGWAGGTQAITRAIIWGRAMCAINCAIDLMGGMCAARFISWAINSAIMAELMAELMLGFRMH